MDEARGRAFADEFDIPRSTTSLGDVLRDVDAVYISTTNEPHNAECIAAARAGRHVLSEKLLASSYADAAEMVEACRAARRRDGRQPSSPQRGDASSDARLWFLGSHAVDALRFVTGDEVVRVQAVRHDGHLRSLGVDTADVHLALLQMRSGAVATLENSWVLPPDSPMVFDFRMEVVGEAGSVQVNTADNGAFRKFTGGGLRGTDLLGSTPTAPGRIGGFVYEAIAQFVDAIVSDGPLLADAGDGLAVVKVLAAIEEAAHTGQAVAVGPD